MPTSLPYCVTHCPVSVSKPILMPDFQRSVSVAVTVAVAVAVAVNTVSVHRPFMPLLMGRVRGNSAASPEARAPSFPRKSGRTADTEK